MAAPFYSLVKLTFHLSPKTCLLIFSKYIYKMLPMGKVKISKILIQDNSFEAIHCVAFPVFKICRCNLFKSYCRVLCPCLSWTNKIFGRNCLSSCFHSGYHCWKCPQTFLYKWWTCLLSRSYLKTIAFQLNCNICKMSIILPLRMLLPMLCHLFILWYVSILYTDIKILLAL